MSNFGEHNEFEKSDLTEEKLNKLIENGELYFDHSLDTKNTSKYSAQIKLTKADQSILPNHLINNYNAYKKWFAE